LLKTKRSWSVGRRVSHIGPSIHFYDLLPRCDADLFAMAVLVAENPLCDCWLRLRSSNGWWSAMPRTSIPVGNGRSW
jgi:hypothetical protein